LGKASSAADIALLIFWGLSLAFSALIFSGG
jgi:hypothetical protein